MRKSNKKTNKSTVSNNGILLFVKNFPKKEINNSCSIISNFMWTFNGT